MSAKTKRIFVNQQISGWKSNINTYGLNLFLEKNSSSITAGWPGNAMTKISDDWFYIDIDSEESGVTACLICPVTNNYWYVGSDYRVNINLSDNNVIYLYENDSKAKMSSGTFTGYAIANGYVEGTNTLVSLTQDGLIQTGTLDLSSEESDTNFWVFPTILSKSDNTYYYVGAVAIAPNDNLELSSFEKYHNNISWGDGKKWTESAHQKYNVKIDLNAGTFTFTPYRTTTIGTAGYTTWSNSEKYEIDDTNVDDVYVVSADGTSKVTLTSKKGSTFPAGEGVIIKGSGEVKINAVASAATATTIGTNYLVGSGNSEKSDIVATEGKTYVFSWDGTNASSVGFYKASGSGKLAAHKAYLELPSTTPARDFVGFDFGGETTGIANVDVNANFDANAPMYNLAGQRVGKNYKGVVIQNGKKMLMK